MILNSLCRVALVATFLFALSNTAKANWTAGQLLNACQRLDQSLRVTGDTVAFNQDFETIYCWGFMSAMQQTSAMYVDGKSMLMSCVPQSATLTQLIKVFVGWGNRHPEMLHHSAAGAVANALLEAFPCGKR